ncbi:MAG: hypothetical protein ACRDIF_02710, partial [Actinomycetota bacterium]
SEDRARRRPEKAVRRRGPLLLAALLAALIAFGFLAAVVSERRIQGAIPGRAPVLSMAVTRAGFLVGTALGAAVNKGGGRWSSAALKKGRTLVAAAGESIFALVEGSLFVTDDLVAFEEVSAGRLAGSAMAASPEGSVYVGAGGRRLFRFAPGGRFSELALGETFPEEILALAVGQGDPPAFYAAGLVSGLWSSLDGGASWMRLLETPSRAVLIDPGDPRRLLLATPGGVLLSGNGGLSWRFSGLRVATEALAVYEGQFFAASTGRVIFSSSNGDTGWEPILPGPGRRQGDRSRPGER